MKFSKPKKKSTTCEFCHKEYDKKELIKLHDKDESFILFGYCSEKCFIKSKTQ